jgi:hypothetical protein
VWSYAGRSARDGRARVTNLSVSTHRSGIFAASSTFARSNIRTVIPILSEQEQLAVRLIGQFWAQNLLRIPTGPSSMGLRLRRAGKSRASPCSAMDLP